MTINRTSRGEKTEGVVQVLILLTIGTVAAAASFTHVHNVAAAHGQPGWLAWADAVTLELMSIATGLEIRRRARTHRKAGFVAAVLITAVALSLAAQVVEAEPSLIGWLAAALPALGFLACVKIVMSRTVARSEPVASAVDFRPFKTAPEPAYPTAPTRPVPAHAVTTVPATQTLEPEPAEPEPPARPADGYALPPLPAELLDQAREVASDYEHRTGKRIGKDELRTLLRLSSATADDVMRSLGFGSPAPAVSAPLNGYAVVDQTA